ncbi:hypothetical protein JT358_12360 [Micrococcales bacterium 31B]|nr:hypothetical protein [Micrococcales bacterium 31B]
MTIAATRTPRHRPMRPLTRTLASTVVQHDGHANFRTTGALTASSYYGREQVSGVLEVGVASSPNAWKRGLEGATVTLVTPDGKPARDVSGNVVAPCVVNRDGRFEFANVAPGVPLQLLIDDGKARRRLKGTEAVAATEWTVVVSDVVAPCLNTCTYACSVKADPGQRMAHYASKWTLWAGWMLFVAVATGIGYFLTHPGMDAAIRPWFD